LFRRESGALASDLIREALAVTQFVYGAPPALQCVHCGKDVALVTFIDADKVRRKRDAGRCYVRAGFDRCTATTKGGLTVVHIAPAALPHAQAPALPLFEPSEQALELTPPDSTRTISVTLIRGR
jgi:hypothetical protein